MAMFGGDSSYETNKKIAYFAIITGFINNASAS